MIFQMVFRIVEQGGALFSTFKTEAELKAHCMTLYARHGDHFEVLSIVNGNELAVDIRVECNLHRVDHASMPGGQSQARFSGGEPL